ncbi:MAG: DNA repair protein RadC [Alphaproteobacteria bacterium]|nr:DNA repair protein RadC [Alphaproteobacteria bacterium]MBF0130785.1 DNA repair protein RadC [Alphaproteobacteria bacterium]
MPEENQEVVSPSASDHSGHRARLRERFLKGGGESMPDYELLELLLTLGIPRRDTKGMAKSLLKRFGSFAQVISADPASLKKDEKYMTDTAVAAVKVVQAAASRLLRGKIGKGSVLGSWEQVLDYCTASMAHEKNEQFRILFLDSRHRLMVDEVQQRGTIDHTPAYPREVARRALELGAASVIIVHNHPSGDPTPSAADKEMTLKVRDAAKAVGVTLHDHIIVGRETYVSFKTKGLL